MWIINRLREASTIRGIIVLAGLFGYSVNQDLSEPIATVVAGLLALVEVIRSEGVHGKRPEAKDQPGGTGEDPQTITSNGQPLSGDNP